MKSTQIALVAAAMLLLAACDKSNALPSQETGNSSARPDDSNNPDRKELPIQFQGKWSEDCSNEESISVLEIGPNTISYYESEGPIRAFVQRGELEVAMISELSGEGGTRLSLAKFRLMNANKTLVDVTDESQRTYSREKCVQSSVSSDLEKTLSPSQSDISGNEGAQLPAPILTRFGNLTSGEDGQLIFEGTPVSPKVLYESSAFYTPIKKFEVGGSDVILFQQAQGNSCPGNYAYVTVSAEGAVATNNFGTCYDASIEPVQSGNSIKFSMPNLGGEGISTFIYESGAVLVNGQPIE